MLYPVVTPKGYAFGVLSLLLECFWGQAGLADDGAQCAVRDFFFSHGHYNGCRTLAEFSVTAPL